MFESFAIYFAVVNKSTVTGKINELEHKNELDVRKTQEAILTPGTQMYLVPPRRLSAYHGGSLPNISYAGSCEDFFNDQVTPPALHCAVRQITNRLGINTE